MVVGEVDGTLTEKRLRQSLAGHGARRCGACISGEVRRARVANNRARGSGMQGDPASGEEQTILNEVVAARRQRVMGGATGEN
jgi:hypothetical protein